MKSENATFFDISRPVIYLSGNERTLLTAVYVLLSVLGLLGNGIAIYVVISMRFYLDVPGNIFILSQALSDFGTGLSLCVYTIHMYIWIWDVFYWYTSIVWLASLGSLFLLTFNRLLSVVGAFSYSRRMTSVRAKMFVVFNWIVALIVALHPLMIPQALVDFNLGRYYIVVISLCVILFNIYLFNEARVRSKEIKRQNQTVAGLQKSLKDDFKSVRTLALVGGTFLVCAIPFTIVTFIYGDDKMTVEFQRYAAFTGTLMPINAILDPVIYYFRGAEFRQFCRKIKRSRESKHCKRKTQIWACRVTRRTTPTNLPCDGPKTIYNDLSKFVLHHGTPG